LKRSQKERSIENHIKCSQIIIESKIAKIIQSINANTNKTPSR